MSKIIFSAKKHLNHLNCVKNKSKKSKSRIKVIFDTQTNPLTPTPHICVIFTILHVWLIISKSWPGKIKNNPIFGIYIKFPIEWWYSFWYLIEKSMRKMLPKLEEKQKKTDFFENRPGVKGLISKVIINFFCQKTLESC